MSSSIPYSGGTIIDTTFTGATRATIASNIITQLTAAGWTSISGSSNDQVMQSATTADGNSICIRVYDPGSGNCARLRIRNASGTQIAANDAFLFPAALKTWRIIACKYNFFVSAPGSIVTRDFACGGTLALPSFLSGVTTGDLGFLWGNSTSDGGGLCDGPRTKLYGTQSSGNAFSAIANGSLHDGFYGSASTSGIPQLVQRGPSFQGNNYRWSDNTLRMIEAELGWGVSGTPSSEGKSFGFIHNCVVNSDSWPIDDRTITSYDGHAWHNLTDNNTSGSNGRGSLFVAIT